VLPVDGYAQLTAYFDGFMLQAGQAVVTGRSPAAAPARRKIA
jgi:hypothetical protein